jgi:ABC-type sugar transport system ATPase subunit
VGDLSLAEKQRIEIVRAISHRPRLLVLDEPTAALAEPEWLFRIVARLAAFGVGVLYISHRLAEVRRCAGAARCCATARASARSTSPAQRMRTSFA